MSSSLHSLGKTPNARKLVADILKEQARLREEQNEIETFDNKQITRSDIDRIIYIVSGHGELGSVVQDPNLKEFQIGIEPDGQYLKSWLTFSDFINTGQLMDKSGLGNHATVIGSPAVQDGPEADLPAWQLQVQDQLKITNNADMNGMGETIGDTFQFRFFPIAVDLQDGMPRILQCKTDDSPGARHYGHIVWIEPDGTLYYHRRVANARFTASKTFAFPSLNKWYNISCKWDAVQQKPYISIDAQQSTEAITGYVSPLIDLPDADLDLYISGCDKGEKGRVEGLLADWRWWKEKIITKQEEENLIMNGYSISPIKYVARVGSWKLPEHELYTGAPGLPPPLGTPPPTPQPEPEPVYQTQHFIDNYFIIDHFL